MATVMSQGRRRCDAVCHNAAGTDCKCICLGKYHGSHLKNPEILATVSSMIASAGAAPVPNEPLPFDAIFEQAEKERNETHNN